MKLTLSAATACVALALATLTPGAAAADDSRPTPRAAEAAPAGTCGTARFCTWTDVDFYGTRYTIPNYGNGTCMTGNGYTARSYINNSSIEGYFYSNTGCSGLARAVTRGSSSRNIGFTARSFSFACVSC